MSETESSSPEPTRFPELNRVLDQLVRGTDKRLGGNLTAVYLELTRFR